MRRGGRILVVFGLLLGAVTAGGTFLVLSSATEQPGRIPTKQVVVAQQPISPRTTIAVDAVAIKDWPETALPQGTFFEKMEDVIGKLALQQIYPGQVILAPMIVDKKLAGEIGVRSNAAYVIPDGKIAMSFAAGDNVAAALQAGDYIDLMLTLSASTPPTTTVRAGTQPVLTGNEGLPVTQLMLQDVLILQVGSWTAATADGKSAAPGTILTLALDRQDALALKSAREQGQIDVILRRAAEPHKAVDTEPVTLQYLNKRFKFNLVPFRQ